jgi:hypothetical protein
MGPGLWMGGSGRNKLDGTQLFSPAPHPDFSGERGPIRPCPASLLLPSAGSPRGMRNEINCLVYLFCYLLGRR